MGSACTKPSVKDVSDQAVATQQSASEKMLQQGQCSIPKTAAVSSADQPLTSSVNGSSGLQDSSQCCSHASNSLTAANPAGSGASLLQQSQQPQADTVTSIAQVSSTAEIREPLSSPVAAAVPPAASAGTAAEAQPAGTSANMQSAAANALPPDTAHAADSSLQAPGGAPAPRHSQHDEDCSTCGRAVTFAECTKPAASEAGRHVQQSTPASQPASIMHHKRSLLQRGPTQYIQDDMLADTPSSDVMEQAVLEQQVNILRTNSNRSEKLWLRRGRLQSSFAAMQQALPQLAVNEVPLAHVHTQAAGLKHIGFGPMKRENQDEFYIQVGEFGGQDGSHLFAVFDGHGSNGRDAAAYSRQLLPKLLDVELRKYFQRIKADSEEGLKGAVEVLMTEVFAETERTLVKSGLNLASSGTTASVAYQHGSRLWVAAVGDSRAILCSMLGEGYWRSLPMTIDHRPRRVSECERVEAAGARVGPKRLPSGYCVGEPRLWLQNANGPGLLLSRSLGDLTAASVGCTCDPEVSYATLRPGIDSYLVIATDGVWDVLSNEQVCDIVVESPDPRIACRRVLDAALFEWEERMSADNIAVLVVEFEWDAQGSGNSHSSNAASITHNSR